MSALVWRTSGATWHVSMSSDEPQKLAPAATVVSRLPVDAFLARLLQHVPPPGFQTVRAYGLYANSQRAPWAVARGQFAQEPELLPLEFTWRDFCERVGHRAAAVCPVCGAPLVVYGRFRAGRGPPPDAVPRLGAAA